MRSYRLALLIPAFAVGLTYACSSSDDSSSQSGALLDPSCKDDTSSPPKTLLCTGLYKDIKAKTLAAGIQAYAPATPLWADGADKLRWIQIPAGQTIDTTDPNEWTFPVGTTAWKEFSVAGKRVETRMWRKVSTKSWVNATYAWSADETSATYSSGGDITGPSGATYHIPTSDECNECHRGRTDRLLGFEQVSLGLDGATGYTLAQLVTDKKLSPAPAATSLSVGDDGTNGANVAAMRWLHVNCGVTCHNTNTGAFAYGVGMNLRMDPTLLTGSSATGFADRQTTLNVPAKEDQWAGETRIVPGDPDNSLIVQLISRREEGQQMPPIATLVVDSADVANVRAWVSALGPPPPADEDAGTDAGAPDSGTTDDDAGIPDAGAPDTGTPEPDSGTVTHMPTDAGALCAANATQETEVNDSAASADTMVVEATGPSSFCGRLTPGDNDYFTFAMPAGTKTWSVSDSSAGGTVTITGTVNGTTFTLTPGGSYTFAPGSTYVFHASSTSATSVDYSLSITISQ